MRGEGMRRLIAALALLLALPLCALAEPITVCGVAADTLDAVLDLGDLREVDVPALVEALDRMPQLQKADMYAAKLSKDEMELLFTRYPQIDFGWTIKMAEHTVRTDATAFSTLHNSHSEAHGSKTFEPLKYCRHLKAIDLGHNWVEDIAFLRNFPELKVLILGRNQIRDLSVIGELTQLEYLEIFSNHIVDISPLANLTQLLDLNIAYNQIGDLTPLYALTQIERLWGFKNKKLTNADMQALEDVNPDCEYDWVNNPTAGTWREHPRYFVIKEMFATGVYRPFDAMETVSNEETGGNNQ